MTEEEWLTCGEPEQVLKLLDWRTRDRKMRLFACACCRQIWDLLTHTECRTAIEVSERAVDGVASEDEMRQALEAAMQVADDTFSGSRAPDASAYATSAVADATSPFSGPSKIAVSSCVASAVACHTSEAVSEAIYDEVYASAERTALATHANILRDIFGNPFRPVAFHPAWRTDTAVAVARQMYDSRDFGAMPILADALQDAGCEDEHILTHCRDTTAPHVRGCWVCDLVLTKS